MDDCWALRDHLNTVRKVVDAKGYVVSSLEYNAFGALVSATGEMPLFRYTGKLFDDDTALQWNVNRWYDSNVGRWISEDPIGFGGKDYNLSRYVGHNPLSRSDFDGKAWVPRKMAGLGSDGDVGTYGGVFPYCWRWRGEYNIGVNDDSVSVSATSWYFWWAYSQWGNHWTLGRSASASASITFACKPNGDIFISDGTQSKKDEGGYVGAVVALEPSALIGEIITVKVHAMAHYGTNIKYDIVAGGEVQVPNVGMYTSISISTTGETFTVAPIFVLSDIQVTFAV